MRRFRFRPQPPLRLRSPLERSAKKELGARMADVAGVDRRLDAAGRGLDECAEQAARGDAVGQLARALETGLRRHRWRLVRDRLVAEQQLEAARVDYTGKVKDLHVLEQLRERQHSEWLQEAQRAEQAELDEWAVLTCAQVGDRDGDGEGGAAWSA
jgi:flagellar export protein FliJ